MTRSFCPANCRKLSYADIKKVATSLFTSATERESKTICQVEPMTTGQRMLLGFFERKEFASSSLRQMRFVKIAFNVRQNELSANEVMKHLVPIIEHPHDMLTRPSVINILSAQWRAAGVILLNLLDRKRFGFSIL